MFLRYSDLVGNTHFEPWETDASNWCFWGQMVAFTEPTSHGIPWEPGPISAHATNWAETTAWLCPESTRTHFPLVALLGQISGKPGGTKLGIACLECPKKNPVPCKWLLVMFRVARPMPLSLLKQSLLFVHFMLKIERRSRSKHKSGSPK